LRGDLTVSFAYVDVFKRFTVDVNTEFVQNVYGSSDALRQQFHRCPSCQEENSFPDIKPTIPEDTIELQRLTGVVACQNNGCK
jgi:hypothetical protein